MSTETLTQERAAELFDYDGRQLIWRDRPLSDFKTERDRKFWNTRYAGKVAGCMNSNGYVRVIVDSREYRAHRIIFLLHYGRLPEQIDHINGIVNDNRIANLRAANNQINGCNTKRPKDNTSGRIGVCWDKSNSRWLASIGVKGRQITLGRFRAFEEACAARSVAEVKYGFHPNHGRAAATLGESV